MPLRRKKIRYRKIAFKISQKQKRLIERYCLFLGMTPNKLIKQSIREFLERNSHLIPEEEEEMKNQLKLFDFEEAEPVQMTLEMAIEMEMEAMMSEK